MCFNQHRVKELLARHRAIQASSTRWLRQEGAEWLWTNRYVFTGLFNLYSSTQGFPKRRYPDRKYASSPGFGWFSVGLTTPPIKTFYCYKNADEAPQRFVSGLCSEMEWKFFTSDQRLRVLIAPSSVDGVSFFKLKDVPLSFRIPHDLKLQQNKMDYFVQSTFRDILFQLYDHTFFFIDSNVSS